MIRPSSPGPETTECVCEPRQVWTAPTCFDRVRSLMSRMRNPRKRSGLTSSCTPSSPQSLRPRVSSTDMTRRSPTIEMSPWPPGHTTELTSSGRPPPEGFGIIVHGKVGGELSEEDAYRSAEATVVNILASVKQHLGSLERVRRVVKITGMVNSASGFQRQFAVIDGASDLLYQLFGPQAGQHARSAVGMFELPHGFCMEIEAIFEIEAS